jgi:hypothetical protein
VSQVLFTETAPSKESVGNKSKLFIATDGQDKPSADQPVKKREADLCLGPGCKREVPRDAPWGRFFVDGKLRGVCGKACSDAFAENRWNYQEPLMAAAD